jgi:ubiquinone/menaquinone biosynthesis C-methylase UbiE
MSWDRIWEEVFAAQAWGKYPDESFIRFVARNFYRREPRSDVKILEIGCGPGANIWYMAREGFDAHGIDGSSTAIVQAKQRLAAEGLGAHLTVGDIIKMPYADGQFDAVADNACLSHNSSLHMLEILKEIRRVLKPRGMFYSRAFTERVHIGMAQKQVGLLEYTDISDGPFAGRGFVRLTTRAYIDEVYARFFKICSVDRREYTQDNEQMNISEWIVYAQKQ